MAESSGGSIWLRPERGLRGPAPEHTRGQIAAAGIALADADGLAAVTMRAVATALGTGPASLYRYVATRSELLELMIDQVNGEMVLAELSGDWLADVLALAGASREAYLRHPWMLDTFGSRTPVGPRAVDYLEHALAALAGLDVANRTKMEAIAVFSGVVVQLTRAEVDLRDVGQTVPQWQKAQAEYLTQVVMAGRHPHLIAAFTAEPPGGEQEPPELLFDRVLTRVLRGLLDAG
ncbi:TetR/AcrR family transcriptional regulator C-terminal domain-containing protein [Longispora sp. K20-0274]|uniref:TetR/AcrR family transcriptional regulator C-terminal domain-containing protein n=1 Tax=Longispora sp. K20-0274 TaxID=3088255 RepID=UPI00399B39A3